MKPTGTATFDLRDERDREIEREDDAATNVEPWTNVDAVSRLLSEYERAQSERGDDARIHLDFGRAALELNGGLEKAATDALSKYTDLAPDDPEGHYLLGAALSCQGKHVRAALAYEAAARLSPNDPDFLMALHFTYFSLLRFEDAINCIEEVERIVKRHRKNKLDVRLFRVWRGIDLLLAGREEGVEQLLRPGTEFDGTICQAAHFGLALLAVQRRDERELEERRSYLESVESPLLLALRAATARGSIDAREAVHALTGRPQTP